MQYIVCECFSMFGMAYEPAGTTPATPGALNFFDSASASDIQIMALLKANLIKEDQSVDGIETEYKPPTCNLVKTVDGKAPNLGCNVELVLVERLEGKGVNNDNPRFPVLADYMQGLNDHEGNSVVDATTCIGQLPDPRISTTTIDVTPGVNEVTTDDGNVSRFCTDPLKSLEEGPDGTWTWVSQLNRTGQITTGNVTALGDGRVLIEFPNGSSQTVASLDSNTVLAELVAIPDSDPDDEVSTYHWEYVIRNLAGEEVNRIVGPTISIPEIRDKNGNIITSGVTILQPSDFVSEGRDVLDTDEVLAMNALGQCVALKIRNQSSVVSTFSGQSSISSGTGLISGRYIRHDDGQGNVGVFDRNCPPITDDKNHAAYLLAFDNGCMERFIAQEHEILHGIDGSGEVDQQIEHRIGSSNRAGGDFSCPISAISSGLYSTNISSLDVEAGGLYSSNTSSRLGSTEGTANSQTSSIQSNLAEGQYSNISTSQTSNNFGVKSSIIASQGSDIGAAGLGTGKPNDAVIIASKDSNIQPNAVSGASNFNGIFASEGSSVTSSVRGVVIGADRGQASNSGSVVLGGQLGVSSDVDGISICGGQATVGTSRTLAHGKALQDAVAFRGLTPIPAPSLPAGATPFEIAVRAALVNQGLAA